MYKTALILAAVGALNWGLVALFSFNLVTFLFGIDSILTNAVYLAVALAAVAAVAIEFTPTNAASTKTTRQATNEPAHSRY